MSDWTPEELEKKHEAGAKNNRELFWIGVVALALVLLFSWFNHKPDSGQCMPEPENSSYCN